MRHAGRHRHRSVTRDSDGPSPPIWPRTGGTWSSTGARPEPWRRSAESLDRRLGARVVAAIAGDVTDPDHRAALVAAAASSAVWTCWSTTPARSGPSPLPHLERLSARRPGGEVYEVNVVAPLALIQLALPLLRRVARHRGRQRHLRRRRRGLRGVGWLRIVEGRPRPAATSVLAVEEPGCGSTGSIPATCAPRCTRTPSRARTSRTGPSRSRSVPALRRLLESGAPSGRYRAADWSAVDEHARRPPADRLDLRPAARARGLRAARGPGADPRRRADAGRHQSTTGRWSRAPSAILPRFLDPGDLVVDQHLGHHAGGRRRRRPTTAPRSWSTSPPSSTRPGGWWSRAGWRPRRPSGGMGRSPSRHLDLGRRGAPLAARRAATGTGAGCGWPASTCGSRTLSWLAVHGRPIRYGYVDRPLAASRSTRTSTPPSPAAPRCRAPAGRSRPRSITRLVAKGVGVTPLVLHTGVASLGGRRAALPRAGTGARVRRPTGSTSPTPTATGSIAIGTTVVRALETGRPTSGAGVHPGDGWTDRGDHPERGVRVVDGLLTGWHEPEASHLLMLRGRRRAASCSSDSYRAALAEGYLWHEFGDVPPDPALTGAGGPATAH